MLIRFNTENFLSFNEKSEFSLIANQERRLPSHFYKGDGINILKSSVIYGANASGKSNFVKAIDFSRRAIVNGLDKLDTLNQHYRLQDGNIEKPTIFQYEIKSNNKYYSYGFAIILKEKKIVEEWLYEIGKAKDKKIFERYINDKGEHEINIGLKLDSNSKIRFDVYREDFISSDKLLFLSEINRKSIKDFEKAIDFKNVYDWFENKLTVLFPHSKFSGINFIGEDKDMSNIFNKFLNIFQTGINNVISEETDLENLDIPNEIKDDLTKNLEKNKSIFFEINGMSYNLNLNEKNEYKIKKIGLEHLNDKNTPITFDIDDESDGTQRLFDFIPALHQMANSDSVFVIDEVDRSLHSKLSYGIFQLFLILTENRESQLIATTHESLLLDLDLFRKDEIWFVEKNEGQSRIYSLDEFKVRNDKKINKDYLLGRYGAIPIFKSFNNLKI